MEPLAAHLEQRDRAAAVLYVRLHLIKTDATTRDIHERSLHLPFPIRDARTLRTLALLDLESNPPAAPIERVTVAVDPTPGRIVQFSLLARPLPTPEQVSTLMARLHALMGDTRCGSPVTVDSWAPGAFAMKPFNPGSGTRDPGLGVRGSRLGNLCSELANWRLGAGVEDRTNGEPEIPGSRIPDPGSRVNVALRRFRHPLPIRVQVSDGKPSSVITTQRGVTGGGVASCAGPWRTSGSWWMQAKSPEPRAQSPTSWDRDEWDVALADGPTYRVFRERETNTWFLEGVMD
jgi:hypothetical protein